MNAAPDTDELLKARLAMLGVIAVCWSGAFTAIKVGVSYLDPFDLTALRFLVAAPALLILLALRGLPGLTPREKIPFAIVAIISVPGYHFALNWGETTVTAGVAALIVATGPMWTVLFSSILLKEQLTSLKISGILISLVGVVVIVLGRGADLSIGYTIGALVTLLAPMAWAYGTVLSKPLVMRHGAERLTAAATLAGTALLLPILLTGTPGRATTLPSEAWLAVAFLGIFATVLGYLGFNFALKRLSSSETMSFVYLNPVFGLLWSYLLLSEVPTFVTLAGGAVVIVGIVLANQRAPAARSVPLAGGN